MDCSHCILPPPINILQLQHTLSTMVGEFVDLMLVLHDLPPASLAYITPHTNKPFVNIRKQRLCCANCMLFTNTEREGELVRTVICATITTKRTTPRRERQLQQHDNNHCGLENMRKKKRVIYSSLPSLGSFFSSTTFLLAPTLCV